MRKVIARRLSEAKQAIPHIYLTIDVQLDALLKLRTELNASLASRGIKLSVNDMLIKALGLAPPIGLPPPATILASRTPKGSAASTLSATSLKC
jgi:hypothetical protein